MSKTYAKLLAGAMSLALITANVHGVEANRSEAWSGGLNGWTDEAYNATLSNPGNYLQLAFPAQSILMPSEDSVSGGVDASGGVFSGDYISVGATNITFSLMTDGHLPAVIRFVLRGAASGREWSYSAVSVSDQPGVWVLNNVPLAYSSDLWRLSEPGATEALFIEDLRNVASIGIRIQQSGTSAQTYSVDEFCLHGVNLHETIRGRVMYSGFQAGKLKVVANLEAMNWTGTNIAVLAGAGSYELSGVPTRADYWIKAYIDANNNGIPDTWEPMGLYPVTPVTLLKPLDNVDIALAETKTADGLPVWWVLKYFGGEGAGGAGETASSASGDPDKDGMSNLQEYLAGTNPNDAGSTFEAKVENKPGGTGVVLKWRSAYVGQKFAVWRCSDLVAGFSQLQGGIDATPPENTFEDTSATAAGPYFYRVKIE